MFFQSRAVEGIKISNSVITLLLLILVESHSSFVHLFRLCVLNYDVTMKVMMMGWDASV